MNHPGINIKLLRKSRGISQADLASMTGMSKSFLSEVENCKTEISARRLWQIAHYLETTMDALMEMNTCPTCGQKIAQQVDACDHDYQKVHGSKTDYWECSKCGDVKAALG